MTRHWQSHLAMLAFSALVAGAFALGVRIANDITPAALMVVRFAIAAALLVWLTGTHKVANLLKTGRLWRFVVLGSCLAFYFILMFEGLKIAGSVSMAAVFTLTPILSGVFGYFLLRQSQSFTSWLALAVGGVGAIWVIFSGSLARFLAFDVGAGEMMFFFGVVAHAVYTPMVRMLNSDAHPLPFTALTTVGALIVLLVYGTGDVLRTDFTALSLQVWAVTFYLAIFASAVTFLLLQFAALHLNSANVMAYTYLVPTWVILWELALGGALPVPQIWGGVALTIAAMLVLLRKVRRPESQEI